MVQGGGLDVDLLQEPLDDLLVARQALIKDLDDAALEDGVLDELDEALGDRF
jgi:hypothetical protein